MIKHNREKIYLDVGPAMRNVAGCLKHAFIFYFISNYSVKQKFQMLCTVEN